jgi:DNA-binding NarL/FixJ family response regulator
MVYNEDKRKNILVIDDQPEGLDLILNSFGYETDIARNSREALEKIFPSSNYDLIIVDLMMPGMPGSELIQRIRQHQEIKTVPIIMVTAFHSQENQVTCLQVGADDYISKPFEILNLIARIESLLRRVSWHQRPSLSLPEGVSDLNEVLTKRQVEILKLMSQGFSNKQMANKLFLSETTIKAHLRTIFKKLNVSNRTQAVLVGINKGLIA